WTGLHPEWKPADAGPDGWDQEVGCVYYESPDAVVLVDPLAPPEDEERYGAATDGPLPAGVEAHAAPAGEETVYRLPAHGALVFGDVVLGADGGVRLCPESWL